MADFTPMKSQYNEIKSKYKDCLLFFRLGDFYELFDEDAKTASAELNLALTTRDRGKEPEKQTPMCGVPFHAVDSYIARLIKKGYKVAVCEQTEEPSRSKIIINRDVIRVITPGTVLDPSMLDETKSNYIASVYSDEKTGAAAFCDVSTGEFCLSAFDDEAGGHVTRIINELARFAPAEVVLNGFSADHGELSEFAAKILNCKAERRDDLFERAACEAAVAGQFGSAGSGAFEQNVADAAYSAAGGLLIYLGETQKCDLAHINTLDIFSENRYMELDHQTRRNLELTENLQTGEKKGSLLWVLDKTKTPMGSRLLRSWVERPLLSPQAIKRRLSAVSELFSDSVKRGEISTALKTVGDIPRLMSRVAYGSANARDLAALGDWCETLPVITALLKGSESLLLRETEKTDLLADVSGKIKQTVREAPPLSVREGGIIREGFSEEVDRLRRMAEHGADEIGSTECFERERTGIKKLKIGYNKVFGYYIDIPHSSGTPELPEEYIRKQTTSSSERYFTKGLKELEEQLLTARDKAAELEFRLFDELRRDIAGEMTRIQKVADSVALLDALCALAEVAAQNNYTCPEIDLTKTIDIREGRHPVVEAAQKETLFVPNDVFLNGEGDRLAIITGPNMAGKSTYMRQTALTVLLAQIGSFVPAKSASVGITDRIFTRIGAQDNLAGGKSTFMVEMTEIAAILKYATGSGLLILDEIGRGTSTYDGMAMAKAILEYCADKRKLGARTMFATHYHELAASEGTVDGVVNYNITAKKKGGELIFLRKVVRGSADDSYGIEVAKLAGVPESVTNKAGEYLKGLEKEPKKTAARPAIEPRADNQMSMADISGERVLDRIRSLSPETITPIEALTILYELKRSLTQTN